MVWMGFGESIQGILYGGGNRGIKSRIFTNLCIHKTLDYHLMGWQSTTNIVDFLMGQTEVDNSKFEFSGTLFIYDDVRRMATVSCTPHDRSVPLTRVLVVEDYERFRNFVCTTLAKRDDFQIVGETADGLEAVHMAAELRPDLILMDIGLPGLNGIEAARRIIAHRPECKMIFLTQEDSAEVIEAALSLGAHGYVIKAHAESELLLAIDAARDGGKFVSSVVACRCGPYNGKPAGMNPVSGSIPFGDPHAKPEPEKAQARTHQAHFHSDDSSLLAGFTLFIEKALKAGGSAIVIASEEHRKKLLQGLQSRGVDLAEAAEQGRYIARDVHEVLSKFIVNNRVDQARFFKVVGDMINEIKTTNGDSPISAYSECAPTLWAQGNADAAVQLELLSNEVVQIYNVDVLCGYLIKGVQSPRDKDIYERICTAHSAFLSH